MIRQFTRDTCLLSFVLVAVAGGWSAGAAFAAAERRTLSNGIPVILVQDTSKPLVALALLVNGSSRLETEEFDGVSHMLEHIVVRGPSQTQGILEFRQKLWELGAESVYTTSDYVFYSFEVPKENFADTLTRFQDMTLGLTVQASEVDKEREVVSQELRMDLDNPWSQLYDTLDEATFKLHPYRRPVIGSETVVRNIPPERIEAFYHQTFVPKNLVLAVVGDIDPDAVTAQLNDSFGKVADTPAFPELSAGQDTFNDTPTVVIKVMDTPNIYLARAYRITTGPVPDLAELQVFARLFGKGDNSVLYKALVDTRLATQAFADTYVRRRGTTFIVGAVLKDPAHYTKAVAAIQQALTDTLKNGFSADDVEKARRKVYSDEVLGKESLNARANEYGFWEVLGDFSGYDKYLSNLRNLDAKNVVAAAAKYLNTNAHFQAVIKPKGALLATAADNQTTLANGLPVVYRPSNSYPVVAGTLYFSGGVLGEAKPGLNLLTTRLLLKGTKSYDAKKLKDLLDENGIEMSADGAWDYSAISFRAPAEGVDTVLKAFAEILTQPTFPADEIAKTKDDIITDIKSEESDNFGAAHRVFFKAFFGNAPYANDPKGTEESLNSIQTEDIQAHFKKVFAPKNAVLVVAGAADPVDLTQKLQQALAGWQGGDAPLIAGHPYQSNTGTIRKERSDSHQVVLMFGYPAPPAGDPDYLPMVLVRSVLGNNLFKRFVYQEGLAYRMWTRFSPSLQPPLFYVETGLSPENVKYVHDEVLKEIQKMQKDGVSDEDLKSAKARYRAGQVMAAALSSSLASNIGLYALFGLGSDFWEKLPDAVDSVTADQVKAAANKYLADSNLLLLFTGPGVDKY